VKFNIPASLQAEHKELHAVLTKAIQEPGKLGEAAKNVAEILDPHFEKEEEFALPPLGALVELSAGNFSPVMKEILSMTGWLKAELPQMLEEHKKIVAALQDLTAEAGKVGKEEYIIFAENLTLHAKTEEEVLYPASMLIGEYIKSRIT
jgi:iron-sulfur cluster repair protein YtfE (RIC family)